MRAIDSNVNSKNGSKKAFNFLSKVFIFSALGAALVPSQ
jgi:hypothetical protein